MGFPRQEYWSELPLSSPGDLPDPGIKPASPALQADSLLLSHQGSLLNHHIMYFKYSKDLWFLLVEKDICKPRSRYLLWLLQCHLFLNACVCLCVCVCVCVCVQNKLGNLFISLSVSLYDPLSSFLSSSYGYF